MAHDKLFQFAWRLSYVLLHNNKYNLGDMTSMWSLSDSSSFLELRHECTKASQKQSNKNKKIRLLEGSNQSELA